MVVEQHLLPWNVVPTVSLRTRRHKQKGDLFSCHVVFPDSPSCVSHCAVLALALAAHTLPFDGVRGYHFRANNSPQRSRGGNFAPKRMQIFPNIYLILLGQCPVDGEKRWFLLLAASPAPTSTGQSRGKWAPGPLLQQSLLAFLSSFLLFSFLQK